MHEPISHHLDLLGKAVRAGDGSAVLKVVESLHYADLASYLETINGEEEKKFFIKTLGPTRFATVLAELPDELVESSLKYLSTTEQRELFAALSDDDQTEVVRALSDETQFATLSLLNTKDEELVRRLLRYDENTAGGWMTTQVGCVSSSMTVKKALEALRSNLESTDTLSRIFVVDESGVLEGKLRLRDLAFSTWDTPIRDIMMPVEHPILATADQEEVAQTIKKYDLMMLAVIDESDRFLGIVTHDDAMEIAELESTEDMERLAGLTGELSEQSYLYTTVLTHFRRRFLWLFFLALLAVASGYVMLRYEEVLSGVYMLALFLPMVIAAGGNTGGQAATMVIRSMALGELGTKDSAAVAWKELRLGGLLGAILAGLSAVLCFTLLPIFRAPLPETVTVWQFGTAVSIALGLQVTLSTLIGALLPLGAKALKLDPAVIASPAITTIVDVVGMVIYFTIAQAVLGL